MPRRATKPRVDIRDQKATIVLLDASLTFNGGTLDDDVTAVWFAIKAALATAAHAWSGVLLDGRLALHGAGQDEEAN